MTERISHGEDRALGGLASEEGCLPAMPVMAGVSRRAVLSGAVVASALTLSSAPSAWAAISPWPGTLRAVFDRSVPQGRAFAQRAGDRGIPTFSFAGDMSRLWFDKVLPGLRANPGSVLGLTGAGALFCFEQLAWDIGMRVRLRIDHPEAPDGFRHVAGVDLPPSVFARLEAAKRAFGSSAFDAALDCRAAWGDCTHATAPGTTAAGAGALVTWIIAPLGLA